MKFRVWMFLAAAILGQELMAASESRWKAVEEAMGRQGQLQADGALKFSMPRKDLKVSVAGTPVQPGLALSSWTAFANDGSNSVMMGDLVLTEAEVEAVMLKLQEGGIAVTALHNHLLNELPRVMYMHISGNGDAAKLARAVHDALALTQTPAATPSATPAAPPKVDLPTAQIDDLLARKGKNNNGIYQFSVPRGEKITEDGMEIPRSLGLATAINFQPTGAGRAAITGDFVLVADEVNPVLQALRQNGIQVTAIHSHMLREQPRLFFMHFWGNDDAVKLAHGLRAALDKTHSGR